MAAPLQARDASLRGAGSTRGPSTSDRAVPPTLTATDHPLGEARPSTPSSSASARAPTAPLPHARRGGASTGARRPAARPRWPLSAPAAARTRSPSWPRSAGPVPGGRRGRARRARRRRRLPPRGAAPGRRCRRPRPGRHAASVVACSPPSADARRRPAARGRRGRAARRVRVHRLQADLPRPAARPPPSEFTRRRPRRRRGQGRAAPGARRRRRRRRSCRDLVNTPPNDLCPAEFAARGAAAGEKAGLEVEVLDEKALAAGGYGGILAVGQGSTRRRGWCGSPTPAPAPARRSRWSARASRSTPAASRSSPRRACRR